MLHSVILVGEPPLTPALAARAQAAGRPVWTHVLDTASPGAAAVVEAWAAGLPQARAPAEAVVVELVDTSLALKRATLLALDQALPPATPILTSTLAVSLAEVATWPRRPERLVGLALLPPLTETSRAELAVLPEQGTALAEARALLEGLGLAVETVQDSAGGVLPRIVAGLINEAAFALGEGVADAAGIDEAMRLGVAYPRGPLAWAREIGFPRVVAILDALHREMPDGRYRVAPWLRQQARREQQRRG